MTKLLHLNDNHLQQFQAKIMEGRTETKAVVLDQTAFYPGGGGQPCDTGKPEAGSEVFPVIDVKKRGDEVPQYVKGPLPPVGQDVLGSVDWERRYQLMRTHSALHVLCGVIWRDYKMHVTSASMKPLVGRLDFVPNIPK